MIATPPRGAVRLIELFVTAGTTKPVLGDLEEEFAERPRRVRTSAARRWYWRHALRTTVHLAWGSVRAAPWSTAALVLGSLVLAAVADSRSTARRSCCSLTSTPTTTSARSGSGGPPTPSGSSPSHSHSGGRCAAIARGREMHHHSSPLLGSPGRHVMHTRCSPGYARQRRSSSSIGTSFPLGVRGSDMPLATCARPDRLLLRSSVQTCPGHDLSLRSGACTARSADGACSRCAPPGRPAR